MTGGIVLLGSFEHETNTFVDRPTTRADFRTRRERFGEAVERLRDTETASCWRSTARWFPGEATTARDR